MTPATARDALWRLPAVRLRWAFWDEEFVVFHPGTGQAHLLDVLAAEALDCLALGPATTGDVAMALAELAEGAAMGSAGTAGHAVPAGWTGLGFERMAGEALLQLSAQGLIRPADRSLPEPPVETEDGIGTSRPATIGADLSCAEPGPAPASGFASDLPYGLTLAIGPARFRLAGRDPMLAAHLARHYEGCLASDDNGPVDAEIRVAPVGAFRRRAHVLVDGRAPSSPFPIALTPPFVEWAMNWALATRAHRFLLVHAAVVAPDGGAGDDRTGCSRAIVLAGYPGAGKSTLCAALVAARGWRLLSDEFLILDLAGGGILPLPRPVAVKNTAIEALLKLAPHALPGPRYGDTPKGTLAYLAAPRDSLRRQHEAARASVVVFPRFAPEVSLATPPLPRARALMRLADNAFNFGICGAAGFEALKDLVNGCVAYDLAFGNLAAAVDFLEAVAEKATAEPLRSPAAICRRAGRR